VGIPYENPVMLLIWDIHCEVNPQAKRISKGVKRVKRETLQHLRFRSVYLGYTCADATHQKPNLPAIVSAPTRKVVILIRVNPTASLAWVKWFFPTRRVKTCQLDLGMARWSKTGVYLLVST